MIDCSFSPYAKEICYIPDAKKGDWYILLITNYSMKPGNISFRKQSGSSTTNCNIIIDATSTGPYCEGDNIFLTVNNAPEGASFVWTGPNDFSSNEKSPIINDASLDFAGSYFVQMTSNGIKSDKVEVFVEINKNQQKDTTITIEAGTYLIFGDTTLKTTGIYSHKFISNTGCDSIINLTLNIKDRNAVIAKNTGPYCEGETIQLSATNIPSDATLAWNGPNGFSSSELEPTIKNATIGNAGTYSLSVIINGDAYKAPDTKVQVFENVSNKIIKKLTYGSSYQFGELVIEKSGEYEQIFTNIDGCDSTVHMTVRIIIPDSLTILPETVISPNADGINDKWQIKNIDLYKDAKITIYNRDGKKIREYNGYDNTDGWDGTDINGNHLPSTDYWYTIDISVIDKIYVGHFTLIRR